MCQCTIHSISYFSDRKFWHAPDKAKRNTSPGCCASSVYVLALTISTACMLFLYDGLQVTVR